MLIQKLPQTPYTAFPVDWQVWAQENMFILHSANLFCDERWTLLGNQILHRRSGIISIHVTHPRLYKCLQVHVIANARLVRFVLVRLSPNWPNTSETAVNGRCQQEMWQHKPRFLFHRERVQMRSYLACLVAEQWIVSKPDAASQHNRLSLSTGHLNFVSVRHK